MKVAVEQTRQVIVRLARHHRNLVVAVVVLVFVTLAGAAWQVSWRPLLLFCGLFPLCGVTILLDTMLTHRWHRTLVAEWVADRLDPDVFVAAMGSLRTLPPHTLHGLLETLPTRARLGRPSASIPVETRRLVQLVFLGQHRFESEHTLATVLLHTALLLILGWSAVTLDWEALAWLGVLPIVWAIAYLARQYRRRAWLAQVRKLQIEGIPWQE